MDETAVLSGTIEGVLFRRPETGFVVLKVRPDDGADALTVVGEMLAAPPGSMVRAEGHFQNDRAWGRQFRARLLTVVPPPDHVAVVDYLASGVVKGMRAKTARKLADHFGEAIVGVIEDAPERLREIKGIGQALAGRIHEGWTTEKASRDILLFLHSHGIRPVRAQRILNAYGSGAVAKVLVDPYLLARDIKGIGFETADALAERLGIPKDAEVRRRAALVEVLRRAVEDGHSATLCHEIVGAAAALLGVGEGEIEAAIDGALAERRVALVQADGARYLMLQELRNAEHRIAGRLKALLSTHPSWSDASPFDLIGPAEKKLDIELAPGQREALAVALSAKVTVITGGPGTGKTTLVRALVAATEGRVEKVRLAAPTGRAARRLAESTGRTTSTLHRLLEADPARGFNRNRLNPLDVEILVVDEASMVDLHLMAALLQALPDEAALVLVGDADQLPPVGPGQALADIIQSRVAPVARLNEIFRQAAESDIVKNAHRVIKGRMPVFRGSETPDAFGVRAGDAEEAILKVLDLVTTRIPEGFGIEQAGIQVLTPVNRGNIGTRTLNARLQAALNPSPGPMIEQGGQRLALGDKVMQTENDYQREVYNGDIGRIVEVETKARRLQVGFDERRVAYEGEALGSLVPAYAITVHKAQGSEYPAVVLVLMREHGRMLKRRLLYTAMTRAQRLLVIVAEQEALERAVAFADPIRRSLLRHEIGLAFDLEEDAHGSLGPTA